MGRHRFRTGLAVIGGCAALAILVPPLAGLLNVVASLTMLGLAAYAAYRCWAFMESVVDASRRPTTVRRNLESQRSRSPERGPQPEDPDPPGRDEVARERPRRLRIRPHPARDQAAIRDR